MSKSKKIGTTPASTNQLIDTSEFLERQEAYADAISSMISLGIVEDDIPDDQLPEETLKKIKQALCNLIDEYKANIKLAEALKEFACMLLKEEGKELEEPIQI